MTEHAVAQPQRMTALTDTSTRSHLLRRKCACGGTPGLDGECAGCRRKRLALRRRSTDHAELSTAPPIVNEVLRSPGRPLDAATRAFMEPRFGHDFSKVRVHTDARAAESARAVSALAYTVGQDVVFEAGQYAPGSEAGGRLLAHELTHVVQQNGTEGPPSSLRLSSLDDPSEQQADQLSDCIMRGNHGRTASWQTFSGLQRTIRVDSPGDQIPNPTGQGVVQTNAETVRDYLTKLCPTGGVTVDPATGVVNVPSSFCTRPWWQGWWPWPFTESPAEASNTPTSCTCLCDVANSYYEWEIRVDDTIAVPETVANVEKHDEHDPITQQPQTGITLKGGGIKVPSPNNPKAWGAATERGKLLDVEPWLLLGHELCGHARMMEQGRTSPEESSGPREHEVTIEQENLLRTEHGIPERASSSFKEPYCGESYWRDKSSRPPSPKEVHWTVNPSSPSETFLDLCRQWRDKYNREHGTHYKIRDKIP